MDDKRSLIIGLNSAFAAVSVIAITTRLLTRIFIIKRLGVDDILITIALFLALGHASCFILSVRYGQGLHIQYLDPANLPAYTIVILLSGFWYNLCQMFIKLSYLTFYLRLAVTRRFQVILYISMAIVTAFGIATSIVCMVLCMPWAKLWDPDTSGHCLDVKSYYISASALNVVFDTAIFILPIPILWSLKLPRRQRIGLTGVFAVGLIVVIASILRTNAIIVLLNTPAYRKDNTWSTVDSLNWSTVEVHLALLISCAAAFKALIQRYLPGLLGPLSITKDSSSRNLYSFSMRGGGYLRQSRNPNDSNFKTVIRASSNKVNDNGSENHIVEDLEMSRYNTTVSGRAVSEASINFGVIEDRSSVGSA